MRKLAPLVWTYDAGAEVAGLASDLPSRAMLLPQVDSRAFGDGTHPTTRVCVGALDFLARRDRPRQVLDVGTGTGILARVARRRGADRIAATDIDPAALAAARENFALDGSAVDIELGNHPPDHWGPCFDVVVANILEGVLRNLAPALARATAPGGVLLLSGFTPVQAPAIRVAFQQEGLRPESDAQLEEWALVVMKRPT